MDISGAHTAIVTPFNDDGVDCRGLGRLVEFQVANGIAGILGVGTTGESPTLTWKEHREVNAMIAKKIRRRVIFIAGVGSNNTAETLSGAEHAAKIGATAILLVDPYYNGPSSLEIRREYVEPVAKAFPQLIVIPYIIPGRTGCKLFPEDLAIAYKKYGNVRVVKEATGDIENMRRIREVCGPDFTILSGDDGKLVEMVNDPAVKATGVISVVSNVVPYSTVNLAHSLRNGEAELTNTILSQIKPLFGLVTVTTEESTPFGKVDCRARNPLAIKTLMAILGMLEGGCRQPLGKMTPKGLEFVLKTARKVFTNAPEVFNPIAHFFNVNIEERLYDPKYLEGLAYEDGYE